VLGSFGKKKKTGINTVLTIMPLWYLFFQVNHKVRYFSFLAFLNWWHIVNTHPNEEHNQNKNKKGNYLGKK
jgi:hypothetical protein